MNPIEKRIAEVLEHVALTGDVITNDEAEQIVQRCQIRGLTVDDVLGGKTPKSIAQRWMHRRMTVRIEHAETSQNGKHFPLLPFSKVVHDDDDVSRWTFPVTLRVREEEVDIVRLTQAINTVLGHHPIFSMHIEEDDTHWYDPSYRSPFIKAEVNNQAGYVYLSFTLNRILGDATSFVLFAQNIWRAYRGEELPYDTYLSYLEQYEQKMQSTEFAEHAQWLIDHYGSPNYPLLPRQDSVEGLLPETVPTPLIVQPDYVEQLTAFSQKEHISINAFYCLVAALAIMDYNEVDEAGLTWAFLGRETRQQMHIFGSLHRDIPMKITKRGVTNVIGRATEHGLHSLYTQLREQIEQGILHSDYPFTLTSPKDSPWHTAVNVLVQPSLAEASEGCPANFELVPAELPSESYCMLDINITLEPLTLTFTYSPRYYEQESIKCFASLITKNARYLLGIDTTTL